MFKHQGERIFQAYLTELFPLVMSAMAGSLQDAAWFVERAELELLPWSDEECTKMVFPAWEFGWSSGTVRMETNTNLRLTFSV